MSPSPRGRVGTKPGRGTAVQVSDDQRRKARLSVCSNANGPDDAEMLLDILGLLVEPEDPR